MKLETKICIPTYTNLVL